MLVGAKFEDEVASQLGPGSGDKVRSEEVKICFTSDKNHVKALDEVDGVHISIIDVAPDDKVFLVDISQLQNTIITARVDQTSINSSACDLVKEQK